MFLIIGVQHGSHSPMIGDFLPGPFDMFFTQLERTNIRIKIWKSFTCLVKYQHSFAILKDSEKTIRAAR
tara:strand:+ start:453 stop:659 length:207 start_codon:yes stop_codon:yes gene_type:complete